MNISAIKGDDSPNPFTIYGFRSLRWWWTFAHRESNAMPGPGLSPRGKARLTARWRTRRPCCQRPRTRAAPRGKPPNLGGSCVTIRTVMALSIPVISTELLPHLYSFIEWFSSPWNNKLKLNGHNCMLQVLNIYLHLPQIWSKCR